MLTDFERERDECFGAAPLLLTTGKEDPGVSTALRDEKGSQSPWELKS